MPPIFPRWTIDTTFDHFISLLTCVPCYHILWQISHFELHVISMETKYHIGINAVLVCFVLFGLTITHIKYKFTVMKISGLF